MSKKVNAKTNRVMCPNFGHPALTPSFTKYNFFQIKNSFATLVNELSVLKLFQLFSQKVLHLFCSCGISQPQLICTKYGISQKSQNLNYG